MKKLSLLFLLFNLYTFCFAQNYTIDEIPDPKAKSQNNFVSNPDGILNNVDTLNKIIAKIEKTSRIEIAVVVVNDFEKDKDDFDFALDLFNNWKIGKAGSKNGLLLFIATDRRKYRFISGDGVEGILPDVVLKRTGENFLVPAFKKGDYKGGIISAISEISNILLKPAYKAELETLIAKEEKESKIILNIFLYTLLSLLLLPFIFKFNNGKAIVYFSKKNPNSLSIPSLSVIAISCILAIPVTHFLLSFDLLVNLNFYIKILLYIFSVYSFILLFKYKYDLKALKEQYNDYKNFLKAVQNFHEKNLWLLLFSPFTLIGFIFYSIKRKKAVERFIQILDSKNKPMERLDRDIHISANQYLSKSQCREEGINVYSYEIWISTENKNEFIIKAWPGIKYNKFSQCPECKSKTLSNKLRNCYNCEYIYPKNNYYNFIKKTSSLLIFSFILYVSALFLIQQCYASNDPTKSAAIFCISLIFICITALIIFKAQIKKTIIFSKKNNRKVSIIDNVIIVLSNNLIIIGPIPIGYYLLSFSSFKDFIIGIEPLLYITLCLPFIIFATYLRCLRIVKQQHIDYKNYLDSIQNFHKKTWWILLFSPLILIGIIIFFFKRKKAVKRFTPVTNNLGKPLYRLDRDINIAGDPYLSKGQQTEEILNAYDYEIWINKEDANEYVTKNWPANRYHKVIACPKCKFRTFEIKLITIKKATNKAKGEAKKVKKCAFCAYEEFIKTTVLAKRIFSGNAKSSLFGSSSSSNDGGSSSSSGSWGGGSSSGGGAGGSW